MRLLKHDEIDDKFSLTEDLQGRHIPPYAILSHTWGLKKEEVVLKDIVDGTGASKAGFAKLRFCAKQAKEDGLDHFWVDTCCIDQANSVEVSEAIISMFRWYRSAARCYVYLADVLTTNEQNSQLLDSDCDSAFRKSRWFTRGWTLQELLAPTTVEFFTCNGKRLGNKGSLKQQIHEITGIPIAALDGTTILSRFDVEERFKWAESRQTTRAEDEAYSLLGIFNVYIPAMYGEGKENAIRRLRKEINDAMQGEDASNYQQASNVHFYVPRTTNSLFTGRHEAVTQIARAITETSGITQQRRFVVTGIGGLGKSELCLYIANQVRKLFWGIFWVDVSSPATASTAFATVAQRLGSAGKGVNDALYSLSNPGDKRNWLLILDNADDPDHDYAQYFPSGALGAVLITSRNPRCSIYSTVGSLELTSLDEEDCINLLVKSLGTTAAGREELIPAARSVVKTLNYHTLALLNAGAYIGDGHCSIAHYPTHYHRVRERLLKFSPTQMQSRYSSIYATFEVSAQALELSETEAALDALRLLEVISTLHYENIPLEMFQDVWDGARRALGTDEEDKNLDKLTRRHVSRLPQFLGAYNEMWDSFRLTSAVQRLQSLGLARTSKLKDVWTLSMHPLTHHWAKQRQDHTELQVQRRRAMSSSILALSRYAHVSWRPCRACLGPHLLALVSQLSAAVILPQDLLQTISHIGWLLQDLRLDHDLAALLTRIFHLCGADPDIPYEEFLPLYSLASRNRYHLGDIQIATRVQQIVVGMQKLDNVHQTRMDSEDTLAALYVANGQTKDAIRLLEHVVRARESALAEGHPSRLVSQQVLAGVYQADGQVKKAVTLLEHVVRVEEGTLAEDHPDRLASQHELARVYEADGQVKKAVTLLEHVVRVQEGTLAEDHPDRLASQHELARVYQADGQVKKAVTLLEHVVRVREGTLAEDHPSRLASQQVLAGVYQADGQVKKAVTLLEHVVRVEEGTLAEDHPSRLASQHVLAGVYEADGQVKKAVTLLEHVVRVQEGTLAEDHPDRLASQHELARVYQADGQVKKAVTLLEHVVRVEEGTLAEDHPSRLASQHVLAGVYQADGQVKKAVTLLEHVVRVHEGTLAEDHPDRLASQHELARVYQADGQVKKAVTLLEHVVRVREGTLAEDHPDRLASQEWLQYLYIEY